MQRNTDKTPARCQRKPALTHTSFSLTPAIQQKLCTFLNLLGADETTVVPIIQYVENGVSNWPRDWVRSLDFSNRIATNCALVG